MSIFIQSYVNSHLHVSTLYNSNVSHYTCTCDVSNRKKRGTRHNNKTRYLKVDDWIGTVRLYVDKYKKTITDHINIKCPTFVDRWFYHVIIVLLFLEQHRNICQRIYNAGVSFVCYFVCFGLYSVFEAGFFKLTICLIKTALGHSKLISSSSDNHTKNMVASERNCFIYLFFFKFGFFGGEAFFNKREIFFFKLKKIKSGQR